MRLTHLVEKRSDQKIEIHEGNRDETNSIVGGYKNLRPPRYPQHPRNHGFGQKSEYDKSPANNLHLHMSQVDTAGAASTDERRKSTLAIARAGSLPTDQLEDYVSDILLLQEPKIEKTRRSTVVNPHSGRASDIEPMIVQVKEINTMVSQTNPLNSSQQLFAPGNSVHEGSILDQPELLQMIQGDADADYPSTMQMPDIKLFTQAINRNGNFSNTLSRIHHKDAQGLTKDKTSRTIFSIDST